MMNEREKSDPATVAVKSTNKAGQPGEEWMEPRAGAKENVDRQSTLRAQDRVGVSQALGRIRKAARQNKTEKFTTLLHHVDVRLLRESYSHCWWLLRLPLQSHQSRLLRLEGATTSHKFMSLRILTERWLFRKCRFYLRCQRAYQTRVTFGLYSRAEKGISPLTCKPGKALSLRVEDIGRRRLLTQPRPGRQLPVVSAFRVSRG